MLRPKFRFSQDILTVYFHCLNDKVLDALKKKSAGMISLSEGHEPRCLSSGVFPSPFLGSAGLLEPLQGNTTPWILYLYGLLPLSCGAFNFWGGVGETGDAFISVCVLS